MTAVAPGQQAQDTVTMATAMWQMMSSMFQQQQHGAFQGMSSGTAWTAFPQAVGTPVGYPIFPGIVGTPRFPAPAQVHNTLMRTPVMVRNTMNPAHASQETGSMMYLSQLFNQFSHHSTLGTVTPPFWLSTNHLRIGSTKSSSSLRVHHIPTEFDQTAATRVSRGRSSWFQRESTMCSVWQPAVHWDRFAPRADNADDFLQEIDSLIPTDDMLQDKIICKMQPSLRAALKHCSKIARGVETSEDIVDTPLCDPPSSHKSKIKFVTLQNVLGKEHYRLKVNPSADYRPAPPTLSSAMGAKD